MQTHHQVKQHYRTIMHCGCVCDKYKKKLNKKKNMKEKTGSNNVWSDIAMQTADP